MLGRERPLKTTCMRLYVFCLSRFLSSSVLPSYLEARRAHDWFGLGQYCDCYRFKFLLFYRVSDHSLRWRACLDLLIAEAFIRLL